MPLAADIRECPVTWGLAASWTLIFLALLGVQYALGVAAPAMTMGDPLGISSVVSHRFGDLTWAEVRQGEVWRLITATFIHFGLIHIAMNVSALIKLGQLVEPWYSGGPFLAVCLIIGGLGNLVGGLLRVGVNAVRTLLVGTPPARIFPGWFDTGGPAGIEAAWYIHSAGGSTILLGLLGLGAVVGWRSKTRIGSFLRDQMVMALILTAGLGFVLVNLLDNYGHAGGAIVGAAIGFVHRPLLRVSEQSRAFRLGSWGLSLLVIAASFGSAIRDNQQEAQQRAHAEAVEARFRRDDATLGDLDHLANQFARSTTQAIATGAGGNWGDLDLAAAEPTIKRLAAAPASPPREPLSLAIENPGQVRRDLEAALTRLTSHPLDAWGPDAAEALTDLHARGQRALNQPPGYPDVYAFTLAWIEARRAIILDLHSARSEMVRLARDGE